MTDRQYNELATSMDQRWPCRVRQTKASHPSASCWPPQGPSLVCSWAIGGANLLAMQWASRCLCSRRASTGTTTSPISAASASQAAPQ